MSANAPTMAGAPRYTQVRAVAGRTARS